jgi:hypothetical protein
LKSTLTASDRASILDGWLDRATESLVEGQLLWIDGNLSRDAAKFLRERTEAATGIPVNLFEVRPDWDLVLAPLTTSFPQIEDIAAVRADQRRASGDL